MNYIRVAFINEEPVRVSDDSFSQSGQTQSLSYIPGSTMRGAVIEELRRSPKFRELLKKQGRESVQKEINPLLSEKVRFLNAYPVFRDHELIPSLKGFYEDKKDTGGEAKAIESVVKDGDIIPGHKRASLGTFGYPDKDTFHFTSVEKSGDLKINLGRCGKDTKNVFRNQYLCAGYEFAAYIGVAESGLKEELEALLQEMKNHDRLVLGNSRSSGLGKCRITEIGESLNLPYEAYAESENVQGKAYMVLLSDTAMLSDEGEIVGLREDVLQKKLGVSEFSMERCSTSVTWVQGYNRTWETHVPSVPMFQMGSVFRLTFSGTLTGEAMLRVENEGLGIRRNEGFGRVLFLKNYENLQRKQKIDGDIRAAISSGKFEPLQGNDNDDSIVLRIAARGVYENILERKTQEYLSHPAKWSGSISSSQMGTARAILSKYRYSPDDGIAALERYLTHQKEKREQRNYHGAEGFTVEDLSSMAADIMNKPLKETLGIETKEVFGFSFDEVFRDEIGRRKMDLLIQRIDRENREAKRLSAGIVVKGGQSNE